KERGPGAETPIPRRVIVSEVRTRDTSRSRPPGLPSKPADGHHEAADTPDEHGDQRAAIDRADPREWIEGGEHRLLEGADGKERGWQLEERPRPQGEERAGDDPQGRDGQVHEGGGGGRVRNDPGPRGGRGGKAEGPRHEGQRERAPAPGKPYAVEDHADGG